MRHDEKYFDRAAHALRTRSANPDLRGHSWPIQRPTDHF